MIPVDQTLFGVESNRACSAAPGNCYAACLASIFECGLSDVPDFAHFWKPGMTPNEAWPDYERANNNWLVGRGLALISTPVLSLQCSDPDNFTPHCILTGPSPRNFDECHAVVCRGNEPIHDPHPSRLFLAGDQSLWRYQFFVMR